MFGSPKTPLSRPSWGPRTAATSPQRRTRAERIRTRAGARRRASPTRTARLRPDFGDLGGADRDGDRAARRQKKVPNQVFIGNEGASGRARTQDERPVRFVAAGDVLRDRGGPRKAEKGAPRAMVPRKVTIVTFFAIAISLTKFIKLCSSIFFAFGCHVNYTPDSSLRK